MLRVLYASLEMVNGTNGTSLHSVGMSPLWRNPQATLPTMNLMLGRVEISYNEPYNRRPKRLQSWGLMDVSAANRNKEDEEATNES